MPRPLRINYPHAWYHVMNRGSGRQRIFKNDTHRLMFLKLLGQCHQMFNITICAYCLMDNHYHLLLSTPDANLARAMRHLNGVYTQFYNRSLRRDGALFRGRYKAKLIDEDCYQLMVSRYIHLNPVDAGIVSHPSEYRWSSYQAYLDLVETPDWLFKGIILKELSEIKLLSHVKNYQDYVEGRTMDEINVFQSIKFTKPIIGSERFKEKILSNIDSATIAVSHADYKRAKTMPAIELVMTCVCAFYCISRKSLLQTKRHTLNWPRHIFMYICRRSFGFTLRDIARCVGHCSASVSSSLGKCDERLRQSPHLLNEIDAIYKEIKMKILEGD